MDGMLLLFQMMAKKALLSCYTLIDINWVFFYSQLNKICSKQNSFKHTNRQTKRNTNKKKPNIEFFA